MTSIYVDATTLITLGTIGEVELLTAFDDDLVILPSVRAEVTTEPASTNLDRLCERDQVTSTPPVPIDRDQAMEVLDESQPSGDIDIIGAVLAHQTNDTPAAVVSDDRRVRTVARGFDADVTGTVGTIVRAVEEGLSEDEANAIVRRVDTHGLHMTAELRAKAEALIEAAASSDFQ